MGNFECCGPVYGDCIDVRAFAHQYTVSVEDAAFKGTECPWHYIIVGTKGHIAPSGNGMLYVSYGKDRKGSPDDHSFNVSELVKYARKIGA